MTRRRVQLLVLLAACGVVACDRSTPEPPLPDRGADVDPLLARAIDRAVQIARDDPGSGAAYGELGRLYHGNKLFDLARRSYEIAARLERGRADWPYYLGVLAGERGRSTDAVAWLEASAEVEPDYAPVWLRLGDVLRTAGDADGAEAAYRRGLTLEADHPAALVGLGKIARHRGRFDEAVQLLLRATAREPRHGEAFYLLAMSYRALDRSAEADRSLERFGQLDGSPAPSDPRMDGLRELATGIPVLLRRAGELLSQDELGRAESLYREVLALDAGQYPALVNLGNVYVRQRRLDEAAAMLRRAVATQPNGPHAYFGLAMCYAGLGQTDAAVEQLEHVLDIDPDHAEARNMLRRLKAL